MCALRTVLAMAAFAVALSANRSECAESPPAGGQFKVDMEMMLWQDIPKYPRAANDKAALRPPIAAYAEIWQPQWQEELGLTAEQKAKLLAIHAKAVAEQNAEVRAIQETVARRTGGPGEGVGRHAVAVVAAFRAGRLRPDRGGAHSAPGSNAQGVCVSLRGRQSCLTTPRRGGKSLHPGAGRRSASPGQRSLGRDFRECPSIRPKRCGAC